MGLKDWFSKNILSLEPSSVPSSSSSSSPSSSSPSSSSSSLPRIRATPRTLRDVAPPASPPPRFEGKVPPPEEKPDISAEEIYRSAGVTPPGHGYTVEKVGDMLANPRFASMTPEERATAVLVALEAAGVAVDEVLRDAVAKDRALDAFEEFRTKQVNELKTRLDMESIELQVAIDAFVREKTAQIEANREKIAEAEAALATWRRSKAKVEEELARVVDHFTDENPVTLSAPPPSEKELLAETAADAPSEDACSRPDTPAAAREISPGTGPLPELRLPGAPPLPRPLDLKSLKARSAEGDDEE